MADDFDVESFPDEFTIVRVGDEFTVEQWPDEFIILDNSDDWTIYTTVEAQYTLEFQSVGLNDAAIAVAARDAAVAAQVQADADVVLTHADVVLTHADAAQTAADRIQTGLDKAGTAADRVQTGLDSVATAADRVQTGLDRTQTGLDKTATAADRVQTGLDRAQTGADRVQTGLDRVATGNDVTTANALLAAFTGGTTGQILIKHSNANYDFSWTNPTGMLTAIYDPTNIAADVFARANHTGTQLAATISNFNAAADARIAAAVGVSVQGYSAILAGTTASYTVALDTKLGGIAAGADVTVSALAPAIHGAASKTAPVDADELALSDSAAAFGLKKLTWANLKEGIRAFLFSTNKPVPVDADGVAISDSAASGAPKHSTWTQIKAFLKTYFDTLYVAVGTYTAADVLTKIKTVDGAGSGLDADLLDGFNSAATATASTVAVRDGSADMVVRLLRSEWASGGWTGGYILCQNAVGSGADNYGRPVDLATFKTTVGIGTMANRSVTISAAAPSGGADGDVWFMI